MDFYIEPSWCFSLFIESCFNKFLFHYEEPRLLHRINNKHSYFLPMQNVEAISRYTKLFYKFQSSLKKVKHSWIVFLYELKEAITKKLDSVIKGWKNLAKDMAKVIKVICSKYSKIYSFSSHTYPLNPFLPNVPTLYHLEFLEKELRLLSGNFPLLQQQTDVLTFSYS